MIYGAVFARGVGRAAIALALTSELNTLIRWFQKYVMEIEPVTLGAFTTIMVLGGVIAWAIGDLLALGAEQK